MKYLVDTNIFLHTINSNIYGVAALCKELSSCINITPTILMELEPGYYLEQQDKSSKEIYTCVNNLTNGCLKVIEIFELADIEGAKEEFQRIRKRFYSWMNDANYLNYLIEQGTLKREDIKLLKKKDLGECELLAIAKVSKGSYWIVSNDKGEVYQHPNQNIFKAYENDPDVTILLGSDWIEKIGYKCSDDT